MLINDPEKQDFWSKMANFDRSEGLIFAIFGIKKSFSGLFQSCFGLVYEMFGFYFWYQAIYFWVYFEHQRSITDPEI